MHSLELWGGPECTVNRVGDNFRDQLRTSGHHDRLQDLELFAELGISAIRYPVLWERVSPDDPQSFDWTWTDERLTRLRALKLKPIVGLVHHGSGPRHTNLLSNNFAPGLAAFAGAAARRYPWVEAWTPINEPVTTARFSALYGHWYPHARDELSFWTALLNQIDGVRLSMNAIREVNSQAKLIQTEDLGRTYATAAVRDQAAFDNVRRWMGWDLLCGRVVPGHALWQRLCSHGLEPRLRVIADAPCPPDMLGINHYLTSDRFLDHRIQRYPPGLRGGNAKRAYADTEAVRVLQPPPPGLEGVLREAWERYGLPLAVTETHNGCTREEQMRWMAQAWQTAQRLRGEQIDIRAVTAWALLGSTGWDTLLTQEGRYETGVYEVRDGIPNATAMCALLRALASGATAPIGADGDGWWQRPTRFRHTAIARPAPLKAYPSPRNLADSDRAILIVDHPHASSTRLIAHLRQRGLAYCTMPPGILNGPIAALLAHVATKRPWALALIAESMDIEQLRAACGDVQIINLSASPSAEEIERSLDGALDGAAAVNTQRRAA